MGLRCDSILVGVVRANVSVMRILDVKQVSTLLGVVGTTEKNINFLKSDGLGLRNEEPDKEQEEYIRCHKKEERFRSGIGVESWEELVEDTLSNVLHLRAHADGLGSNVHGENLRCPNPSGRAPRWLVEEDKQEQHCGNGYSGWGRLGQFVSGWVLYVWCFQADQRNCEHAKGHTGGTNNEQKFSAESINGPCRIESKDNTAGRVQGVDQVDSIERSEDALVDCGRVRVQGSLSSKLLANVDDECKKQSLAD